MATNVDTHSPLYNRVSRCIASIIRFHRANASKEGLCPQVIISCYRLRHRWSPKALSHPQSQKEEVVRRILDKMIEVHMLVKVPQKTAPSGRNLPATIEQSYILDPTGETESCRPGESCDDLLISSVFRPNQVMYDSSLPTPNSIINREYVSMSELGPNASRFLIPTNTNILGSSTEVHGHKRRRNSAVNGGSSAMERSNNEKESQFNQQSLTMVSPAGRNQVERGPQSCEVNGSDETQSNAERLAHEVANLPWLTQGLQGLSERYPDDRYELVYENDLLQIKCHDCKGRLYKVHYQNCDVSNMEWHAKSTVHADRVETRIAELGGEAKLTDEVKKRRQALESARKTAPQRFRKPYSRPVATFQPAAPRNSAPQHPGSIWNASLLRERSHQLRTSSQHKQSSIPEQSTPNIRQDFELDSPSGTPPSPSLIVEDFSQNERSSSKIQQLESRVQSLELENIAHERTISVLQNKLRTQQQVNNTHQSVIKDLILRVQALEQKG
ncbi:26bff764-6e7e-4804-a9d2-98259c1cd7f7 [Sclerotinia trifoliorum]|uniref:26bff764-6e7e-4804-a9d2-98259c1cd7f7 n=1 Tax=Sclerotinia trifoliorum TaxID=28548 RepID=A0A8H2VY22_9HELO|nr:26bff764-6e7e-4804-a9d2-98259c1cd7f7 [Sclerotinia trifoliorum]